MDLAGWPARADDEYAKLCQKLLRTPIATNHLVAIPILSKNPDTIAAGVCKALVAPVSQRPAESGCLIQPGGPAVPLIWSAGSLG